MANASAKRLAASNKAQLSQFHRISIAIYGATFIFFRFFHRSIIMQALMCTPAFGAEYILDVWCRPSYGANGQVLRSGHGFQQGGVIEYLKDVIYLTWASLIMSALLGVKAWLLMLLIPVYGFYQAGRLLKAGKQMLSGPPTAGQASEAPPRAK